MAQIIPKGITREHLIEAIERFDNGFEHRFAPSKDYDVEYNGNYYPPKAIVGIAAEIFTGKQFQPSDFKGGEGTISFRVLSANKFRIVQKATRRLQKSAPQIFGPIDGISEGDWFPDKNALRDVGLHRLPRSGIDGSSYGASSIVLNAGYSDDSDNGESILYTGHGGNDEQKRVQIADQQWSAIGNKALLTSELKGIPVRVIRGANHDQGIGKGYVYGGIYFVTAHKQDIGKEGFKICRFYLKKNPSDETHSGDKILPDGNTTPGRISSLASKVVRNTELAAKIKALYKNQCQVCGTRIEVGGIAYAEAAHIKPLGEPHRGGDVPGNLLCLCPNHHLLFDLGGFGIKKDFSLTGIPGKLKLNRDHTIDPNNISYHQEKIFIDTTL